MAASSTVEPLPVFTKIASWLHQPELLLADQPLVVPPVPGRWFETMSDFSSSSVKLTGSAPCWSIVVSLTKGS